MFVLFLFGYFDSICGLFLPNVGKIYYTLLCNFRFLVFKMYGFRLEGVKI
jgi:hypothetical protein